MSYNSQYYETEHHQYYDGRGHHQQLQNPSENYASAPPYRDPNPHSEPLVQTQQNPSPYYNLPEHLNPSTAPPELHSVPYNYANHDYNSSNPTQQIPSDYANSVPNYNYQNPSAPVFNPSTGYEDAGLRDNLSPFARQRYTDNFAHDNPPLVAHNDYRDNSSYLKSSEYKVGNVDVDDVYGGEIYAYDGGKTVPYTAPHTAPSVASNYVQDYGAPCTESKTDSNNVEDYGATHAGPRAASTYVEDYGRAAATYVENYGRDACNYVENYGGSKPVFDDYGNLISNDFGNLSLSNNDYESNYDARNGSNYDNDYESNYDARNGSNYGSNSAKIVKAVPKAESEDSNNGVQKFRVQVLPDYGDQNTLDVLCQVGLDGIRMLDPNTNRTLRIYSLENITRWEVTDPSIYTFWSKTAVDHEPKRISLKSNRYTTNTILDTVAAACVQFREMVDDHNAGVSDNSDTSDAPVEKKISLPDWMNLRKPVEEKEHWVPDEAVKKCTSCGTYFGAFVRRHHCRNCGDIFCDKCTQGRTPLTADKDAQTVRVCDRCFAEVTQRLANSKEINSNPSVPKSHEDLTKKLLEEMGKNHKGTSENGTGNLSSAWSSQSNSGGTVKRTKEVACPTCTVHLQVQLPTTGTETVECGICQHPFLVSAG